MKTTHSDATPPGTGGIDRRPRVSVVIPCYNLARYLPEAVASVAKQTYTHLEVVIVDDGSPDDTSAVTRGLMARYPDLSIRLVEQENKGLSEARNAGIAVSTGEYWLPLDADDRIAPTFVEKCLRALESLPEAGFAYTDIAHFGDIDTVFRLPPFDAEAMVHQANIGCVCSLVRREVWEAVGGYDPLMKEGYEDWDFWIGCIENGWSGIHIADPLFFYRKRGGSMLEDARKKHETLAARIVLNHVPLYGVEKIQAAARTIARHTRQAINAGRAGTASMEGRKLTVTYLVHSLLGVTGGNQTLVRQANALAERGHRVNIVTYSERPAWFDFKAKLVRVPAGEAMAGHVPPSDAVIATYFLNAPELVSIDAPACIYFAQGDQYVFGDDSPIADPAARAERERMRRLCAESYTLPGIRFVANSYNLAATVYHRYGRMADAVLPPCSDPKIFRPLERKPPPPWRILVVGPDARGSDAEPLTFKGIGDIRQAVDLLGQNGLDFRVVRMSNTTADIFKGFPCEFHFKPADRKKTKIFGTAHILVYGSHYDSRPHPPMEAMASGAAVVCTATPGNLEYCRHEENALLVPVASPGAIAEAIGRITADPDLYRRLVTAGRETAARFPKEREWDEMEQLLYRFAGTATPTDESTLRKPAAADAETSVFPGPTAAGNDHLQEDLPMKPIETSPETPADAAETLGRIRTLVANERYDAAVSALNRLLADHPDHPQAHGELGRLHHTLGEPDKAAHHLERAAALAPDRADLQRSLADFYHVAQGRGDKALTIYRGLAAAAPENPEISLMAGHLCVGLHRFDEAGDHYRRVLESSPDHAEAARFLHAVEARSENPGPAGESPRPSRGRAREMAGAGRIDEAVQELEALIARQPDQALAHNDLGVLHYQRGEKARALACYRRAAELAPEDAVFQKNLADFLYVEEGAVTEALGIYVEVLKRKPDDVETLMTTGHICVSQERFEDAAHFYARVLEVDPGHGEARRFLQAVEKRRGQSGDVASLKARADVLAGEGDLAGAAAALERAAALDPENVAVHSRLGELYHQAGETESARVHLGKAAAAAPGDPAVQKRLADFIYVSLGRTAEALALYETLADAHPEDVEILLMAGHLNVAEKRLDAAGKRYRQVLRIEPWHADAGRFLDALDRHRHETAPDPDEAHRRALEKAEAGDEAGAAADLETLVATCPDHALAHNDLGVLCGRRQQWDKALALYQKAVDRAPENTTFQKNLADAYAGMRRFAEALEIYVNLLAADPYDVEALMATGQICAALDRSEDAEHFFTRALEAEPWNTDARSLLDSLKETGGEAAADADELLARAREEAETDRGEAARATLLRLLDADPDNARAHNDLGVLCFQAGREDEAEDHYRRAVALAPAEALYRKNLADFFAVARGRVAEALEIYVNLLATDPYDVEALMATGQICMALDQPDDARHFFVRAQEAEPWNTDARQMLDQLERGQQTAAC